MTLGPLLALPALLAVVLIFTRSLEEAFFRVYLPVLLLLPDGFLWGWPAISAEEYAIIPIGINLLWWGVQGRWKWSSTDVVVFGFVLWTVVSDTHANGTADIVNRIVTPLALSIFPYMAGKLLIEQKGLRVAVARRFVFFLFVDALLCAWEFRFGVNPLRQVFLRLFPVPDQWPVQLRYGFGRAAGPFGHAIFMGAVVAIALLLHQYAMHFGWWEKRFRWFPHLNINKPRVIRWGLVAGSLMTISRGPWIAAIVGALLASIGTAGNRWRALQRTVVVLVVGGALIYFGGKAYVASAKAYASPEELASAEYRAELPQKYNRIAMVRSFWGWGSPDWPKVPGMISIDNWYLLLTLTYGIPGLVLFLIMLIVPAGRLFWVGMMDTNLPGDLRALLFTLLGIIVAIAVAVATVFLGGQLFPLLFLFLGWSDACLLLRPRRLSTVPVFAFRKVIA